MRVKNLIKHTPVMPVQLIELLTYVENRGVIWNPGLSVTVGMKETDNLIVIEGQGKSGPITHHLDISQ